MSRTQGLGWLARGALLAAALLVPACGGVGGSTNPGVTPAFWVSTQSSGTSSPTSSLLWYNPNTGPIGTSGGSPDLDYGTAWPNLYPSPPNALRPVFLTIALMANEEYNIEGQADGYRQAWISQQGGGGVWNNNQWAMISLPPLYISTNLRSVARARCKDLSMGNQNALQTIDARMQVSKLSYSSGSAAEYYNTFPSDVFDAGAAWSEMGTGAQNYALNGGWFGGGYWTTPPYWGLVFCRSTSSTGP